MIRTTKSVYRFCKAFKSSEMMNVIDSICKWDGDMIEFDEKDPRFVPFIPEWRRLPTREEKKKWSAMQVAAGFPAVPENTDTSLSEDELDEIHEKQSACHSCKHMLMLGDSSVTCRLSASVLPFLKSDCPIGVWKHETAQLKRLLSFVSEEKKELVESRQKICMECPHFRFTTRLGVSCGKCGCSSLSLASGTCPDGRWGEKKLSLPVVQHKISESWKTLYSNAEIHKMEQNGSQCASCESSNGTLKDVSVKCDDKPLNLLSGSCKKKLWP